MDCHLTSFFSDALSEKIILVLISNIEVGDARQFVPWPVSLPGENRYFRNSFIGAYMGFFNSWRYGNFAERPEDLPNVWLRSIFTEEGETGWRTCGKQKAPETYGHAINQLSVMSLFLVNLYNQDAELRKQEIENRSLTENVTEYINQHYADSLTIDQLAEQFFVSKYHLMHEFSQKTGTSVYRYLMQQRLHAVCELLEQGTVPNEAYLLCGFKDYANFYRAFRSAYGQSPREYARAHRIAAEEPTAPDA